MEDRQASETCGPEPLRLKPSAMVLRTAGTGAEDLVERRGHRVRAHPVNAGSGNPRSRRTQYGPPEPGVRATRLFAQGERGPPSPAALTPRDPTMSPDSGKGHAARRTACDAYGVVADPSPALHAVLPPSPSFPSSLALHPLGGRRSHRGCSVGDVPCRHGLHVRIPRQARFRRARCPVCRVFRYVRLFNRSPATTSAKHVASRPRLHRGVSSAAGRSAQPSR